MKKVFLLAVMLFAVLLNLIPYPAVITVCPQKSDTKYQESCIGKDKWGLDKNLSPDCTCGVMPGIAMGFPNTVIEGGIVTENATTSVITNLLFAIFPTVLITGFVFLLNKVRQKKR